MARKHGTTLVELCVVIALFGLLLLFAGVGVRGGGSRLMASDVKALLLAARFEAVKRDVPVAVVWQPEASAFAMRVDPLADSLATLCRSGTILERVRSEIYSGVSVTRRLRDDLVWLPTGLARTCQGGGVFNGTIVLEDGRLTYKVVISRAGRVRTEAVQ
ncbi:MAG: GspH/FimT family protein [Trueperaceae bacterium]|nr:MAG: GspH/FimT family protein [Trueperaceae bacterium]